MPALCFSSTSFSKSCTKASSKGPSNGCLNPSSPPEGSKPNHSAAWYALSTCLGRCPPEGCSYP
eukprot:2097754-Alexandrium_andersonii.AAC.1